jgi:hypothetical protein
MTALQQAIETHRELYRSDLNIGQIVSAPRVGSHRSTRPPTTFDYGQVAWVQEPADANGMNLSGRMVKLLGHPEGFGSDFPWSRALYRLRWDCRKNHPNHRGADVPYWRGSLCHELVRFVILREFSVQSAAAVLRYDNPEPILRQALTFIEESMDHARERAEKRAREDEGRGDGAIPVERPAHHVPSQEHVSECPNPVCRARRAA